MRLHPAYLLLIASGIAVVVLGCGGASGDERAICANPPSTAVKERSVDVPHRGPVFDPSALATDEVPQLVVQVTNNQPSTERVRLAIDGVTALDIDLPAATRCRSEEPVFSYVYDLEPGRVDLTLDLQGERSSSSVDIPSSGTVWAVVDVQSKREWGEVSIYETQPSWG